MLAQEILELPDEIAGIKVTPGARYLVFADPSRVDLDAIVEAARDLGMTLVVIPALKPSQGTVRDLVAAYAIKDPK